MSHTLRRSCDPKVVVVVPVYNAADTIDRCMRSVLRQRDVDCRLLVVDHGSVDRSRTLAESFAAVDTRVQVIALDRKPNERRNPARPLNVGFHRALELTGPDDWTWTFRLCADDFLATDDVIARQLAAGEYRKLITATALFFHEQRGYAFRYGPSLKERTLKAYRTGAAYSAAHPANAIRADLLHRALMIRPQLIDEGLDFGEDLDQTCLLLSLVDTSEFGVVDAPYCFKAMGDDTATTAASVGQLWASHLRLHRRNPALSRFRLVRGFAELMLGGLIGERLARRLLQRVAGRNGSFRECDYGVVTARLRELSDEGPLSGNLGAHKNPSVNPRAARHNPRKQK